MTRNGPLSDLWWATPEQLRWFRHLYLGHHRPMSDADNPICVPWFHSLAPEDESSHTLYPIESLATWRQRWQNVNVYRSLMMFNGEGEAVLGPFLVDIDSSEYDDQTSAYRDDIATAQAVAMEVASFLVDRLRVGESDMRVFFSGRKGFNFEVRTHALGVGGDLNAQMERCERIQTDIIDELSTKGILHQVDRVFGPQLFWLQPRHPFVRLHGSINAWESKGTINRSRKTEVTLDDLVTLEWEAIVARSVA